MHAFDISNFHLGLEEIQMLTKQSLREKPFSTAKGKIWTETPSSIPLEDIYTKLRWVKKHRRTFGLVFEELTDVTKLLNEHQLGYCGPVRVLAVGKSLYCDGHALLF